MTTNQTIDGVPRKLLSSLLAWLERANERNDDGDIAEYVELRALLDAPERPTGVFGETFKEPMRDTSYSVDVIQAAQPQGEPVAYRYKEFQQAYENEKPWELATVALGLVYLERKSLAEKGELVGKEREHYMGLTIEPLYAEHPAPVAVERPTHANPPEGAEPCGTHHDNDGLDEMRKPVAGCDHEWQTLHQDRHVTLTGCRKCSRFIEGQGTY